MSAPERDNWCADPTRGWRMDVERDGRSVEGADREAARWRDLDACSPSTERPSVSASSLEEGA